MSGETLDVTAQTEHSVSSYTYFPKVKLSSDLKYFCIRLLKWLIWNLVIRQLKKKLGQKYGVLR